MPAFKVIDAPSNLGIRAAGVEMLPVALKSAGLMTRLGASYGGRVAPLPFNDSRHPVTLLLNGKAIQRYSRSLSDVIVPVVRQGDFPVVLGGDCTILIGAMLALRHIGRYGLFFVDGHLDFYQPEAEPSGEVASMELAFVTGHNPDILANIDGLKPLVRAEDVVAFGFRDEAIQAQEGSQDVRQTALHAIDLTQARTPDFTTAAQQAIALINRPELDGFWIHLDADVLDDEIMPAVDYRMPGGLQFEEVSTLLRLLLDTGKASGMTITIFNPLLDEDGRIAQNFVNCLVDGLNPDPHDE